MTDALQKRRTVFGILRNYFLAGLAITAPVVITFYLVMWIVEFLDGWFKPLIPAAYRPETYLPFYIPGTGVIAALVLLTLIGGFAANIIGRMLVGLGDRIIRHMPVVGSVYSALKQIFQSAVREDGQGFSKVALIEYPRKGLYAVAFVTNAADKRINEVTGEEMTAVFLPTTPNPTSGFLLFVPTQEVNILNMSVEEGAKLVISAGLADEEGDENADPELSAKKLD